VGGYIKQDAKEKAWHTVDYYMFNEKILRAGVSGKRINPGHRDAGKIKSQQKNDS